jgi:hypothetical protein
MSLIVKQIKQGTRNMAKFGKIHREEESDGKQYLI